MGINHQEDDDRIDDALPDEIQLQVDDDRISALPDDILIHVLECLDLPVAVRASALSRRWRHLPRLLSRLLIDVADFMPPRQPNSAVDHIMTTYSDAVRGLLSSNRSVKHLQLSFYLTDPYLCTIGHIVGNVAEGGRINCLELTLWKDVADPSFEQCVLFGQRFMNFFHACPGTFRHLTRLILQNLILEDFDLPNLIDTCNKLRVLSLTSCDTVAGEEYVLKIDAPRSELVTLEIITCGFARVDLIHVPKLGRVVCDTWYEANPPLRLGIVPRLHNICISCNALCNQTPFQLSELLSSTRNLTILYLNFRDQMIWIEPENPKHLSHVFSNLRDVYIYNIFYECDLNWTMFLLEAAPSLNNFYLMLSRHPCERSRCEDSAEKVNVLWDQASSGFKHHHLSLLEIKGFAMDARLMKYIMLVMERAVDLKRIRLLDQDTCERCDSMDNIQSSSSLIRWRFPTEEREKSLIRQQLVDAFSSSVDITIGG